MEKNILGLSINARMLGLAVINGNQLVDFHIQLRKEAWTPRKKELILASLQPWCERYNIINIAVSIPYETQISSKTRELLESLKKHFNENNLSFCFYSPKEIHAFYKEPKTKKELMRELASEHSDLSYYLHKEMKNKNKYYIKLFDAVEVAKIHSQRKIDRTQTGLS